MKVVLLGLTLSATCHAFLLVAPPTSTAFRRPLPPLPMAEDRVIEVTAANNNVAAEAPKSPPKMEEATKTVAEVKKDSPAVVADNKAPPEVPKVEAPKVEEKLVAKESPAVDKPTPETQEKLVAKEPALENPAPVTPKVEGKVEEKLVAKEPTVEKPMPEAPKSEEKLVAKETPVTEKMEAPKAETKVEETLVAKEGPSTVEKLAPEKVVAKDTATTTAEKPDPKMEEKVLAKDTTPAVEKLAPETPKVEEKLVAKEQHAAPEAPNMEEQLVSAKAPEGKDGPLTVDHAVAKASTEPLQIETGATAAANLEPQQQAQEVAAPVAKKAAETATDMIPSEISEALQSVDTIKRSIAQAKMDMEAGTLGKTAYIEKLEECTSQLNQIDQKMQGVITARSSDIEQLTIMLSKLEEQGGAVGQKALSKIGDMAMDIASSGVFDFF